MTKNTETVTTENVKNEATVEVKPAKSRTLEDALKAAIREGKRFSLLRKVFKGKTGQLFYSYSVFVVYPGSKKTFIEMSFTPNIGFVKDGDDDERTGRNSMAYRFINQLCDCGAGLYLEARYHLADPNDKTSKTVFEYYAVAEDANGLTADMRMNPRTPADAQFFNAALAGFGNVREYSPSDFGVVPGLAEAFKNVLMPGEIPTNFDI